MKYIGKKQIEAEPMALGEFIKHSGRNPYANCADRHADEEPGYVIMYEDGYVSWSPKTTFEKAYKVTETYLDRMRIELQEVRERLMKLNDFLYSENRDNISKDDVYLLEEQRNTMERYLKILLNRIHNAEHSDKSCDECQPDAGRPSDCECACGVGTC